MSLKPSETHLAQERKSWQQKRVCNVSQWLYNRNEPERQSVNQLRNDDDQLKKTVWRMLTDRENDAEQRRRECGSVTNTQDAHLWACFTCTRKCFIEESSSFWINGTSKKGEYKSLTLRFDGGKQKCGDVQVTAVGRKQNTTQVKTGSCLHPFHLRRLVCRNHQSQEFLNLGAGSSASGGRVGLPLIGGSVVRSPAPEPTC